MLRYKKLKLFGRLIRVKLSRKDTKGIILAIVGLNPLKISSLSLKIALDVEFRSTAKHLNSKWVACRDTFSTFASSDARALYFESP